MALRTQEGWLGEPKERLRERWPRRGGEHGEFHFVYPGGEPKELGVGWRRSLSVGSGNWKSDRSPHTTADAHVLNNDAPPAVVVEPVESECGPREKGKREALNCL